MRAVAALLDRVVLVLLLAAGGVHAQEARDDVLRRLTPEQREHLWQSMTPQQKAELWRRLTPEQRQAIRERSMPGDREAMRNRMFDDRQRQEQGSAPDAGPGPGPRMGMGGMGMGPMPGGGPGMMGPRRLSPEERQKLREQILESARDLRGGAAEDRQAPRRGERRGKGER